MKVISITEAPGITPTADNVAIVENGFSDDYRRYRVSFWVYSDQRPAFSQISGWNGGVSVYIDRIERQDEDGEERWSCIEGAEYERLEAEFEPSIEAYLEQDWYDSRMEPIPEAI